MIPSFFVYILRCAVHRLAICPEFANCLSFKSFFQRRAICLFFLSFSLYFGKSIPSLLWPSMHSLHFLTVFTLFYTLAFAWKAPTYSGYTCKWQEPFIATAGSLPNTNTWNFMTDGGNWNGEIQKYTSNVRNVRSSGSGTLYIIPQKDAKGAWTSARIESKFTFTPTAGKVTRVEASLRLYGSAATKQGIWPAFWLLGDSNRHGTVWPACGEIDIMENVNGQAIAHGAMHCDVSPGGICNEGTGLGSQISLPDNKYHVYRVEFDRKNTDFRKQTITWYRDGTQFFQMTGAKIAKASVWTALCQKPMFFILNVAVGGTWVSKSSYIEGFYSLY